MAYVAISGDFNARVKEKIHKMLQAELATLGEEPAVHCTGQEPFITNTVWGEHVHLKDVLPDTWCSKRDDLNVRFAIPEHTNSQGKPIYYSSRFKFSSEIKVPPNFGYYDSQTIPNSEPLLATLVEWATKRQEIIARWSAVQDKIESFLRECKSANEAVKLWPDIKMYFNAQDVARLEAKHGRSETQSKAAEVLAGINTDEVMSAAVIARLSGAQV
jgi:hypothetical protein